MPCQHHNRCTQVVQPCRLHAAVQCRRTEFLNRWRLGRSILAHPPLQGSHRNVPSVTIVTVRFSAGIDAGRRLEPRFLRLTTLGTLSEIWFEGK
jgi:hypothetical protein